MKIYKLYLKMKYDDMKEFQRKTSSDLSKFKYYPETDMCLILYAWTEHKKFAKRFKRERSDRFILSIGEVDDNDEYAEFKKDYIDQRLLLHSFKLDSDDDEGYRVKILSTNYEHALIQDCPFDCIVDSLSESTESNYYLLKDEYANALDRLMYSFYHDTLGHESEEDEEYANSQASYGITPMGFYMKSFDRFNEAKLILSVFEDLFNLEEVQIDDDMDIHASSS